MSYDWNEEQRRLRLQREAKLQQEASGMSTPELLRSLSWQEALSEHSCETGDGRLNSSSAGKSDVIRAELRRRDVV